MYINVAYVDDDNPNIEDLSVPLRINNCGYYRLHTTPVIETPHPEAEMTISFYTLPKGKATSISMAEKSLQSLKRET